MNLYEYGDNTEACVIEYLQRLLPQHKIYSTKEEDKSFTYNKKYGDVVIETPTKKHRLDIKTIYVNKNMSKRGAGAVSYDSAIGFVGDYCLFYDPTDEFKPFVLRALSVKTYMQKCQQKKLRKLPSGSHGWYFHPSRMHTTISFDDFIKQFK